MEMNVKQYFTDVTQSLQRSDVAFAYLLEKNLKREDVE